MIKRPKSHFKIWCYDFGSICHFIWCLCYFKRTYFSRWMIFRRCHYRRWSDAVCPCFWTRKISKVINYRSFTIITGCALLIYAGCKAYSFYTAATILAEKFQRYCRCNFKWWIYSSSEHLCWYYCCLHHVRLLCTIFERRFINMEVILAHYYDIAAVILFGIGFFTLLLHRNLIKKS